MKDYKLSNIQNKRHNRAEKIKLRLAVSISLMLCILLFFFINILAVGVTENAKQRLKSLKGYQELLKKRNSEMEKEIQKIIDEKSKIKIIEAYVTKYGATGNPMANGEYPYIGAVAISDRSIPLGSKVVIDGVEYAIEDRTAKWVHKKFDLTTIDIYSNESIDDMLEFGRQIKEVIIMQ